MSVIKTVINFFHGCIDFGTEENSYDISETKTGIVRLLKSMQL